VRPSLAAVLRLVIAEFRFGVGKFAVLELVSVFAITLDHIR